MSETLIDRLRERARRLLMDGMTNKLTADEVGAQAIELIGDLAALEPVSPPPADQQAQIKQAVIQAMQDWQRSREPMTWEGLADRIVAALSAPERPSPPDTGPTIHVTRFDGGIWTCVNCGSTWDHPANRPKFCKPPLAEPSAPTAELPSMIDIPMAWKLTRATKPEHHHEKCSYRTEAMLCDCAAFHVMQAVSGMLKVAPETPPTLAGPSAPTADMLAHHAEHLAWMLETQDLTPEGVDSDGECPECSRHPRDNADEPHDDHGFCINRELAIAAKEARALSASSPAVLPRSGAHEWVAVFDQMGDLPPGTMSCQWCGTYRTAENANATCRKLAGCPPLPPDARTGWQAMETAPKGPRDKEGQ